MYPLAVLVRADTGEAAENFAEIALVVEAHQMAYLRHGYGAAQQQRLAFFYADVVEMLLISTVMTNAKTTIKSMKQNWLLFFRISTSTK